MVDFYDREKDFEKAEDEPRSVSQGELQKVAQDEQEAPIEDPYFPTPEEAIELNGAAHEAYGGQYQGLRAPNELESAINRAQQHYYYGPEEDDNERLATAGAKMAYGLGMNQPFVDGNKRTAAWLTRHFMNENGLGHVLSADQDDEELADHLIGHGAGTHSEQDTINLFLNRLRGGQQRQAAFMYHTSPSTNRESIEREGIRPNWDPEVDDEPGVFMTPKPGDEHVARPDMDVWQVNVDGLPVKEDPWGSPEEAQQLCGHEGGSFYSPQHIGPERIRRVANILDQIHDDLDPRVWDDPASPEPKLKREHHDFIYEKIIGTLEAHGYDGMERWLSLVFTGSLTTYQYSDDSDVDISLFVDTVNFPDWSRAEMIGVMVADCDGTILPGTPFPLQCFVVPPGITREDLYQPGMRSGYELATDTWIVPPDKSRVHDVEHEMNEAYTIALENADKMERLLRYEPDKATQFWHQIHKRRQRDMRAGLGDYAPSNITYKMLANRGLFPSISEASGEYIAKLAAEGWSPEALQFMYRQRRIQQKLETEGYPPEEAKAKAEEMMNKIRLNELASPGEPPSIPSYQPPQQQGDGSMTGLGAEYDALPYSHYFWNMAKIADYDYRMNHEAPDNGLESGTYGSLEDLEQAHPNVMSHATESPITGAINLHALKVAPELQNQGLAGAYMRDLVNYADHNGKTIVLNAESYGDDPGLRTPQLKKWYQSLGFFPNKGGKKDFTFKENHIRYPQRG